MNTNIVQNTITQSNSNNSTIDINYMNDINNNPNLQEFFENEGNYYDGDFKKRWKDYLDFCEKGIKSYNEKEKYI